MRNDFYVKIMIVVCAAAGCLAGFGIDGLLDRQQEKENAKDNTLVREEYDSVFFDGENIPAISPLPEDSVLSPEPTVGPEVTPIKRPVVTRVPREEPIVTQTPKPVEANMPTEVPALAAPTEKAVAPTQGETQEIMPSVTPGKEPEARLTAGPTPPVGLPPSVEPTPSAMPTPDGAETITYPAQIFGQTPMVDRTDEYVTYFEFAMDLISSVEGEIREKNLNEAALFSKFMLKALFCGIDIRSIRINEPIPRDQAALAIHLAAELMEEKGTGTTAKSAGKYVTDIDGCSSSERKAIAYLYEQGIESGYQVSGQAFSPEKSLSEKDAGTWMKRVRECWK